MEEDRLLTLEQVMERVSIKKTEIYRMIKFGLFPRPIKIKKKGKCP